MKNITAMTLDEMKTIYGGTTYYTCKCGYQTTNPGSTVTHMAAKHPGAIAYRFIKWYPLTSKIFGKFIKC